MRAAAVVFVALTGCVAIYDYPEPSVEPGSGVCIAAGSYTIRAVPPTTGRPWREANCAPLGVREVDNALWFDQTETTRGQWRRRMGYDPSEYSAEACADCPVENITWFAALEYANRRSTDEGLAPCYVFEGCFEETRHDDFCEIHRRVTWVDGCDGYRLPTVSEWERASQADTQTAYFCEENTSDILRCPQDYAWIGPSTGSGLTRTGLRGEGRTGYTEQSFGYTGIGTAMAGVGLGPEETRPVATLHPNPWGLYDTVGNVAEWTWDTWPIREPNLEPISDPVAVFETIPPDDGPNSFVRGVRLALGGNVRSATNEALEFTAQAGWRCDPPGPNAPSIGPLGPIGLRLVREVATCEGGSD